ncbi:diguanylate cyclase domain-containing protein [Luteimonas sp. MHLX1A]|nr:diguanylate cyclase [Luteimonas sp. MHLX1A]
MTVSAGASMLEPRDASPADVYRRADEALYRAKSAGRDRIHMA